jgi:hypothetical protein
MHVASALGIKIGSGTGRDQRAWCRPKRNEDWDAKGEVSVGGVSGYVWFGFAVE